MNTRDIHKLMNKFGISLAIFIKNGISYTYIRLSTTEYQFGEKDSILTNYVYN